MTKLKFYYKLGKRKIFKLKKFYINRIRKYIKIQNEYIIYSIYRVRGDIIN